MMEVTEIFMIIFHKRKHWKSVEKVFGIKSVQLVINLVTWIIKLTKFKYQTGPDQFRCTMEARKIYPHFRINSAVLLRITRFLGFASHWNVTGGNLPNAISTSREISATYFHSKMFERDFDINTLFIWRFDQRYS